MNSNPTLNAWLCPGWRGEGGGGGKGEHHRDGGCVAELADHGILEIGALRLVDCDLGGHSDLAVCNLHEGQLHRR